MCHECICYSCSPAYSCKHTAVRYSCKHTAIWSTSQSTIISTHTHERARTHAHTSTHTRSLISHAACTVALGREAWRCAALHPRTARCHTLCSHTSLGLAVRSKLPTEASLVVCANSCDNVIVQRLGALDRLRSSRRIQHEPAKPGREVGRLLRPNNSVAYPHKRPKVDKVRRGR